jgi:hypothetical protein
LSKNIRLNKIASQNKYTNYTNRHSPDIYH